MVDLSRLARIAAVEFTDIVAATTIVRDKLRVLLRDDSYIDFWWSNKIPGRFAYHWERIHIDGTIYRHDNMPHPRWKAWTPSRSTATRETKIMLLIACCLQTLPRPLSAPFWLSLPRTRGYGKRR